MVLSQRSKVSHNAHNALLVLHVLFAVSAQSVVGFR
jgi:cytochrome b